MIRIILADDHAVVRTGLQLIFDATEDLLLEDQCKNGDELIEKLRHNEYDVVIVDISMPGTEIFDLLTDIKQINKDLPIIVFTMNPESSYAVRMFKNGASAFVNKEEQPEVLIKAIRMVAQGRKFYTTEQAEMLANYVSEGNDHQEKPHESLTDREFQVMCLIASGMSKTEMAESLSVSKNTISNHRNNILKKLNVSNNAELTRYVLKYGIIN